MTEQKNKAAASPKDATAQVQEFQQMEQSYKHIIAREKRHCKQQTEQIGRLWHGIVVLSALLALSTMIATFAIMQLPAAAEDNPQAEPEAVTCAADPVEAEPVAVELAPRYAITEAERAEIISAVVCETGGHDPEAAMLVAQCILNAAERDGIRPGEVLDRYQYADYPVELTTTAFEAVADVFDWGNTITDEPILFFYAPDRVRSDWHESMEFVLEHGGHRYFKLPAGVE